MKRLGLLGAGLLGLALLAGLLQCGVIGRFPDNRPAVAASLLCAVAVYFAAVRLSLRGPLPRRALWLVLGVALVLRLGVLAVPPLLSGDVYRYVWDGRVQAQGINPYLYVPADPALAGLRDDLVYPNVNRAEYAPTIYPPMAQLVFAAIGRLAGTVLATRLAMVGFETLAVACLLALLARARLPAERVLVYAWNPLVLWEFAGNGHVDAAAVGLLAAALLLRVRGRDGLAGMALGAAVLVKFLPLAVAPAVWRARAGWRAVAGCIAAILALYALYAGAGTRVLGFLPGYRAEEGHVDGSGIWLLAGLGRLGPLPSFAALLYFAAALAGLAALAAWAAFRPRPAPGTPADVVRLCADAGLLAAALTCVISPHYPWYFAWLALPATVAPLRAVIWLSAAPALLYLDLFDHAFIRPALFYLPALLLLAADLRRRPSLRPDPSPEGIRR